MKPSIPDWNRMGAEMSRVTADVLQPAYVDRLRRIVKVAMCGYAHAGIQLQRARADDPSKHEHQSLSSISVRRLLSSVRNILRRGGMSPRIRAAGSARDMKIEMLRRNAFHSNLAPLRDELFESLFDRHYPQWREFGSVSVNEIPEAQYESIVRDLRDRRVETGFVDYACGLLLCEATLFHCSHMVVVAVRADADAEVNVSLDSLMGKWFSLFDSSDEEAFERTFPVLLGILTAAADKNGAPAENDDGEAREPVPVIQGRIPRILITSPMPWERVRCQLEEHFPDVGLPASDAEPAQWKWLGEAAQYILVLEVDAGIGEASALVQGCLRRLVALARCFRDDPSTARYIAAEAGDLWWGWDADSSIACRLLAIPTGDPAAFVNQRLWAYVEPDPGWRQRHETDSFTLAGHPFVTAEDFAALAASGMPEAWNWLMNDESTAAAEVNHSLDCFETAMSLGAGHRDLPTEVADSWKLIGLITCLETIFGSNRTNVTDGVYSCLRATGVIDAESFKARAIVAKAYDARNDAVHCGRIPPDATMEEELPHIVANVLRARLTKCIANCHMGSTIG